jgi:hypothetical protein
MHVALPDPLMDGLRAAARMEGRTTAAVVREALAAWVAQHNHGRADDGVAEQAGPGGPGADIVSVSEIAQRSGRPISTVQTWRRRYESFPRPAAQLAVGPVWSWSDVERWAARHAAGETRRRRRAVRIDFPEDLPGADLVAAGLADVAARRRSLEAALVSTATTRLGNLGVEVPGRLFDDPTDALYHRVERVVGEAAAHSRYNALRRRLSSFLHALAVVNAKTG